jgi:hypothetical protein
MKKMRAKIEAIAIGGRGFIRLSQLSNEDILTLIAEYPDTAQYFEEIPTDADPIAKNKVAQLPQLK